MGLLINPVWLPILLQTYINQRKKKKKTRMNILCREKTKTKKVSYLKEQNIRKAHVHKK
jgi:hypothetical protein